MPTMGAVEIGFVDSPSQAYQQMVLNVAAVRINPSTDPNVAETDPNWVTITAPPGAGAAGELALDLNAIQNNAKVFNTVQVPAQTYYQVELILDPNTPGTIIPSCPKSGGPLEGCIPYNVTVSPSTSPRFNMSAGIQVTANGLTPLVLDISPGPVTAATAPGGTYQLGKLTIAAASSSVLGNLTGTVTASSGSVSDTQTISAELTSTNQVVASTILNPTSSTKAGFNLQVPAAVGTSGTTYDLFVSGGNDTFDVAKAVTVTRGNTTTQDFSVKSASTNEISGTVTDDSSGNPISGATVNLLQAPSSGASCSTSPIDCVVVASVATDDQGNYTFLAVPLGDYTLQIENTGTDQLLSDLSLGSGTPSCSGSNPSATCDFRLTSTTISGTVSIQPAPTSDKLVTIVAEQSGTNTLEGLEMVTVPAGFTSLPFTIQVPTSVASFDLIASSQDTYLGIPTQYTGHSLGVAAGVSPSTSPTLALTCGGHGSLFGTATSSDAGTRIMLSKPDPNQNLVELMESSTSPAGEFSFCAPPGGYQLQRLEVSQVGPTSTASPVGTPEVVNVPTPAPTSSPCPSTCQNADGSCPGVCGATDAGTL